MCELSVVQWEMKRSMSFLGAEVTERSAMPRIGEVGATCTRVDSDSVRRVIPSHPPTPGQPAQQPLRSRGASGYDQRARLRLHAATLAVAWAAPQGSQSCNEMGRQGRSIIRTGGASTCAAAAGPLRDSECFFLRASESSLAWTGLKASEAIRPSSRSHLYGW